MSSPAPSDAGDVKKPLEQITFRFCSECSNMLYPKENEVDRKLMFTCRTCSYEEEASSSCIFRNILNNSAGETAGVTQDVGSDPTVGASSVPSDSSNGFSRRKSQGAYFYCQCCGRFEVCPERTTPPAANFPFALDQEPASVETDALEMTDVIPADDEEDPATFMTRPEKYFYDLVECDDDDLDEDYEMDCGTAVEASDRDVNMDAHYSSNTGITAA